MSFILFLPNTEGVNTNARSSKKAFFFTSSHRVAEGYADDARPNNIQKLYNTADKLERQAMYNGNHKLAEQAWREYEKAELEYDGKNYVMGVYINLKNPLVYDFNGEEYREVTYNELLKQAMENNNDGVIFKNTFDASNKSTDEMCDVYAVFDSNQIKSATDNIGTFDKGNNDIRYAVSDDQGVENGKDSDGGEEKKEKYFKPGSNRARDIDIVSKTEDGKKNHRLMRNLTESQFTSEETAKDIAEEARSGIYSYSTYSDKADGVTKNNPYGTRVFLSNSK